MVGGAAAPLTCLLFVAMSLHSKAIIAHPLRGTRAVGTLLSLRTGMIERVAGPGRAIRHRLTPRGEATLRKGHEVVGPVLESSFAALTSRQWEELCRLIGRALPEGRSE